MSDWTLAIATIAAVAAVLTLVHRVMAQLLARLDQMGASLRDEIGQRFDEAERRRAHVAADLAERLAQRDAAIDALRRELDAHKREAEQSYVRRDHWIEAEGRTFLKLDKILERLQGVQHG